MAEPTQQKLRAETVKNSLEEELKEATKRSRRYAVAQGITVAGLMGTLAAGAASVIGHKLDPEADLQARVTHEWQSALDQRFGVEHLAVEELKKQMQQILSHPGNPQLQALAASVDATDKRLAVLEQAILSDPEKALALPLLRRDIENVKGSIVVGQAAQKEAVDRLYNLVQWLIGGISLSIFGLGLQALLARKKE